MATPKKDDGPGISLFPFLSILACLSGSIIVIISALSMVQAMRARGAIEKENPLAKEYLELQAQNSDLLDIAEKLEQTERYKEQLEVLEEQKITLLNILQGRESQADSNKRLQKLVEDVKKEIAEIQEDIRAENATIAKLKEEIEKRKIDPMDLRQIIVRPAGSGVVAGKKLYVVEANGGALVLHKDNTNKVTIAMGTIGVNKEYNQFLYEAALNRYSLLLFLVRGDGWSTYLRGAGWAEDKFKLSTTKVPVPGKGIINLSNFEQYMK